VLLPVRESGGISLEWYKNNFMHDESYEEINNAISNYEIPNEILFLPYLTGVNAPDFNSDARGVFYGIKIKHDKYDFTLAVMEGVAHLLRRNVDHIKEAGYSVNEIISTGGAARSDIWSQMKADITGQDLIIPLNEEAACLGAAMIGAVSEGVFKSYEDAIGHCVSIKKWFKPHKAKVYEKKHALFLKLYKSLIPVFRDGKTHKVNV
jgi:xylulokinase